MWPVYPIVRQIHIWCQASNQFLRYRWNEAGYIAVWLPPRQSTDVGHLQYDSSSFSPPRWRLLDFMSAGLLLLLRLLLLLFLRRTSTGSSRWQWSRLDSNSKPKIRVFPAGPQLQARDRKPRIRAPLPDLNCKLAIAMVPAGPEHQAQDHSGPCRTSTTKNLRRYIR